MLRRLFTPRWLGAVVLGVLFAVACYHLGWWQYDRHVAKVERNARLDANYAGPPRPLLDVAATTDLPVARQWTKVTATGRYGGDRQIYVRNRPNQGSYGYEIVAPFTLTSGEHVLVDRGWVENSAEGAAVLPAVPPTPGGDVTITGWVLPGEPSLGRELPAGQLASINLAEAAAATGEPLLGAYVRLAEEQTASGGIAARPVALDPPDRSLGPHQAYAWNWWFMMPLGLVLVWFRIRAELAAEAAARAATDPSAPGAGATPGESSTPGKPASPAKPAKPKKVRIWDEEDG